MFHRNLELAVAVARFMRAGITRNDAFERVAAEGITTTDGHKVSASVSVVKRAYEANCYRIRIGALPHKMKI
jgi:hypothetical protein